MYKLKKIALAVTLLYKADPRALGLMRIGMAIVVIADLLIRGSDLSAHYSNKGFWPTELLHNFGWQPGFWSLHSIAGTSTWELFLFSIHFVAALFLLLGFKTRSATLVTWLLTISLHNRNLFVLQSGDDLLRILLFWGLFLPWNQSYSIDAKQKPLKQNRSAAASVGYFILLASVYFFSAILKNSNEWHSEGSAVYYALSLEQLRLPLVGDWLYQFPALMKILTRFVLYAELIIPFLILWPSRKGTLRLIAFLLIIVIHAGIGSTLYVGLFFVIGMVSALGLLPDFVLDKAENLLHIKTQVPQLKLKTNLYLAFLSNGICVMVIVLCLIINLSCLKNFEYELDDNISQVSNLLRLNQNWGMFSPSVMKNDGWFVLHGIDSIGRQWDLRRNADYVDFAKPKHIVSLYPSDRWRKLAENMQDDRFTFLRPLFCKYTLTHWNEKHPEKKLATLNLYFMEKRSLPDYKTTPVEKKLFCVCVND